MVHFDPLVEVSKNPCLLPAHRERPDLHIATAIGGLGMEPVIEVLRKSGQFECVTGIEALQWCRRTIEIPRSSEIDDKVAVCLTLPMTKSQADVPHGLHFSLRFLAAVNHGDQKMVMRVRNLRQPHPNGPPGIQVRNSGTTSRQFSFAQSDEFILREFDQLFHLQSTLVTRKVLGIKHLSIEAPRIGIGKSFPPIEIRLHASNDGFWGKRTFPNSEKGPVVPYSIQPNVRFAVPGGLLDDFGISEKRLESRRKIDPFAHGSGDRNFGGKDDDCQNYPETFPPARHECTEHSIQWRDQVVFPQVKRAIEWRHGFRHRWPILMKTAKKIFLLALALGTCLFSYSQDKAHLELESPFGSFVEEDFPFFCQTLDAREFGENPEPTNLTPRGIIVKLGNEHYGCFDPDLLRWALIWKANGDGEFLTMDGMAPGSYRLPNRKAPAGQSSLPKPIGTPIVATPALPGWWTGEAPAAGDPRRQEGADEGEIGLGPMPPEKGRFGGIRLTSKGVQLEYTVGETKFTERLILRGAEVERWLRIEPEPTKEKIWSRSSGEWNRFELLPGAKAMVVSEQGTTVLDPSELDRSTDTLPEKLWTEPVILSQSPSSESPPEAAFTFDDVPIPTQNSWKRNVRLVGFDFFPDGRVAICTFDGDVWIVDGLEEGSEEAIWRRFASGLHEPMSLSIVEESIYVSDRNGIVLLVDTDENGEADWYENFSNIVPQTAETREFAMDMVAAKGGGFYLAKGGQVGSTRGIVNGTIVKVSPDGRDYEVVATGLRQPYIGYDPETGILTSSDQQGNWRPATPIYQIEQGRYYGFQPAKLKDKAVHPASIEAPEVWIPHFINQSGASQVWMKNGARMGALNGSLVHIGYNRPEIFKIYLDDRHSQGAAVPILSGFPAGVLKGRVNPIDGRLYLSGFEIWGTSGERVSGLFRVHPTGEPSWIPEKVEATRRGLLLTFAQELSPELAGELGRYSVDRWNYEQTHNYGSGNFKLDGEPGQESVALAGAQLSKDKKSLFIALADMQPSHSLRVTYRLPVPDRTAVDSAYLTIHSLDEINLTDQGFETDEIDMTPKQLLAGATEVEPTAEIGKETSVRYGCVACHATGETDIPAPAVDSAAGAQVAVGPPWIGLWKSRREFSDGSFIKSVDETYLRESILDPGNRVQVGFEMEKTGVGMPSYLGVLKDHEIESIILYIKTLQKAKKSKK